MPTTPRLLPAAKLSPLALLTLTCLACTTPASGSSTDDEGSASEGADDNAPETGTETESETGDEPQLPPQCGDGVPVPGERCWHDVQTLPAPAGLGIIKTFDLEGEGRSALFFGRSSGVNYVSWNDGEGFDAVVQVNLDRPMWAVCEDPRGLVPGSVFAVERANPMTTNADLVRLDRDPNDPGQLRVRARVSLEDYGLACALGDLDGDGQAEVLVSLFGADALTAVRVEADAMTVTQTLAVGRHPRGVRTYDIDGDGQDEVLVALDNYFGSFGAPDAYTGPGEIAVLRASPSGALLEPTTFEVVDQTYDLDLGDLDEDGVVDLIAVGLSRRVVDGNTILPEPGEEMVTILWGDGEGGFGERLDLVGGHSARNSRIADFDGDGRLDFSTITYDLATGSNILQIWFAGATPRSFERVEITLEKGLYFDIGELNNDGVPDFAAIGIPSAGIDLLLSNP